MTRIVPPLILISCLLGCGAVNPAVTAKSDPAETAPTEAVQVKPAPAIAESDAGVARISADDPAEAGAKPARQSSPRPTNRVETDWPAFLGLHGTGISDETGLLDEWPESGPAVLWDMRIGNGYSSPSIRDGKLVIHHRQRDKDIIECLRADDGSPIWKFDYDTDFSDPYGYSNGPRCSPVLTETHCYTFGAQGRLVCLKLDSGELVWERDTAADWKVPGQFFGAGCTPILEGNLLIVLVGGQPNSAVVAFDPATGKTKWESVGKETWDGVETDDPGNPPLVWTDKEMLVSYSSPIAATIHGQRHLLCLVRQGLVSLDPETGRVRFKYWFRAREHESVNAARPVVIGDQIFLSAAYKAGMALLKVNPDGEGYEVVWRDKRGMSTHWSTPIHFDGCLYGFSGRHEDEGMLQCVDLKTGALVWETNGFAGSVTDLEQDPQTGKIKDSRTGKVIPWPFYGRGSATMADGKYFILGERGTLALAKLDRDGWKEISRTSYPKLKYPMWASPVLSHGRLYLRSEDWLTCLDVAQSAE